MLTPKLKAKLIEFNKAWERLKNAVENNSRYISFENKEAMMADYYLKRSFILLDIEQDNEPKAIDDVNLFTDALLIKAEHWEQTMVRR